MTQSRAERKQRRDFAAEAGETGSLYGDDMDEDTPPPGSRKPRAPQPPQTLEVCTFVLGPKNVFRFGFCSQSKGRRLCDWWDLHCQIKMCSKSDVCRVCYLRQHHSQSERCSHLSTLCLMFTCRSRGVAEAGHHQAVRADGAEGWCLSETTAFRMLSPIPLQEAEARLKAGTIKHCALTVLKAAGARGMAIDDIMAAVAAAGLRQWDANSKRVVQFVRISICQPSYLVL